MNPSQWQARLSSGAAPEIPTDLQLPILVSKILAARGFLDPTKLEDFLKPSLKSLRAPESLFGMTQAVDRLFEAFKKNEKIAIYADFDLDGTSGLALLHGGMLGLGYKNLVPYQPKRLSEGYGFHASAARELAQEGVSLIVTIDVGITAVAAVDAATEVGCEVIITDHHLPGEVLPRALAVINPNCKECEAGLGHLCGAGVAFYLLWALRGRFAEEKILPKDFDLKSVLDCFAIGTLTDMVPLVDENRVLVKHGLKVLEKTARPGLKHLLQELGMQDRPLTSQDVAIRFAPKLNALSRLELGLRPIDIFLEEDESAARDLVSEVMKSNSLRLELQKGAEKEALELLESWDDPNFVFVMSENFHQGVVGLVATKLAQNLGRPAFVGAVSASGSVTGSGRIPKDSNYCLVTALQSATAQLLRHGGHSAAAGFEFEVSKNEQVIQALAEHFAKSPELHSTDHSIYYDIDARLSDFDEAALMWLDHLGPFGAEFEVPLFKLEKLQVLKAKSLKGGHLRLTVFDQVDGVSKEAIWFFPPNPKELESQGFGEGCKVDLLCEVQWNYFAGRKSIQILVRDLRCQ